MKEAIITLTPAQMAALAPYERNMKTAVESDWTRGLGSTGAKVLGRILREVAGGPSHVDLSCPDCVLRLCRRVGRWYFDTQEKEREKAALRSLEEAARKEREKEAEALRIEEELKAQQARSIEAAATDLNGEQAPATEKKRRVSKAAVAAAALTGESPENTAKTRRGASNAGRSKGAGSAAQKATRTTKNAK